MLSPLQPQLWGVTLPAVKGAREKALRHIAASRYVPRRDVAKFASSSTGWPLATAADRFLPGNDSPVDWDHMFGPEIGAFSAIAINEIPELQAASDWVKNRSISDRSFGDRISYLAWGETGDQKYMEQVEFEYVRFVGDIISRAEATRAESDEELLRIYLALERARFATELSGDLVVPLALTDVGTSDLVQIAEDLFISPLDEPIQRARAVPLMGGSKVSPLVIAAATHAIVVRGVDIPNDKPFNRLFRSVEVDLDRVQRLVQCLHIRSGRNTGYAQAFIRPHDWSDDWQHDLPPVFRVGEYHQYPDSFDDVGWQQERTPLEREDVEALPRMFSVLESGPPNVHLAARRSWQAMLRNNDEDATIDSTIGVEALLIGDQEKEGVTHRMAQRAAAALSRRDFDPEIIYDLVKKIYAQRSAIVHGRTKWKESVSIEGDMFLAKDLATFLLRLLLTDLLESDEIWTTKSLDKMLLRSLSSENLRQD